MPDTAADVLGERGYERLRRTAETHREDLVLRLGAEVGLRPAEMGRLRLGDIDSYGERSREEHFFLQVRSANGLERETYLPAPVEHDLRKYASAADQPTEKPLFEVSTRRLQMLVREVAERAGETWPDLAGVSSRDLRWRFAASLLTDGVPPHVVCALGGWERVALLEPLLSTPDRKTVTEAMAGAATPPRADLDRTISAITAVSDRLTTAGTVDEVVQQVCNELATSDRFEFAWLAGRTGDTLRHRAAAGIDAETVETQRRDHADAITSSFDAGEIRTVEQSTGTSVIAFVPVGRDHTTPYVLVVGATAAIGDAERDLLAALGILVGQSLTAVERKRLLLADTVTELGFRCTDDQAFVVGLSAALGCTVDLSGVVPVDDRSLLYYLVIEGASTDEMLAYASDDDTVSSTRLVEEYRDGALIEVVVTAAPALLLVERGCRVRDIEADGGTARLVAELPSDAEVRPIVDAVRDAYPETALTAKREAERPTETEAGFRDRLSNHLSERQETVLRAAYHSGYFEWPRESTAEVLAGSFDVSSPTFHNHLRKAQQKLLTAFFDEAVDGRSPSELR